jgi:5-methylcytosine-specific restriction endonuclease McrA
MRAAPRFSYWIRAISCENKAYSWMVQADLIGVNRDARKNLTKTLRFEVFKRDSFTCQYCGRKAPDVLLQVDHIEPVSKGGTNDILNLITSCEDCNSGKSDRPLSDGSVIEKQRTQLAELQRRKEQIEMMFQWQKGLLNLEDDVILQLAEFWSEVVAGSSLSEYGLRGLKKLKRRFPIGEIMAAMKIAAEHYLVYHDGNVTSESAEEAWRRVGGICNVRRQEQESPHVQRLYYIRGILRNRLSYLNEGKALQLLHKAAAANASIDSLEAHAKTVGSWTQWRNELESYIHDQQKSRDELVADAAG